MSQDYWRIDPESLKPYLGLNPNRDEGLENIKSKGDSRGSKNAVYDVESGEEITNEEVLRELARREFALWWAAEKRHYTPYSGEDANSFDVGLMQRLFCAGFREGYKKELKYYKQKKRNSDLDERILEPAPLEPTARVVDRQLVEGSRLYEVELIDPDYPGDRLAFEVQVDNHGETILQEHQ